MSSKVIDIAQFAQESADSVVNGNSSNVVSQLQLLPKNQSIAATAYIVHYLSEGDARARDMVPYLLRRLTDKL